MKSVMNYSFARVPSVKTPRSTFDRSHGHKTTFDAGKLIPFFYDEALPGDTLNLKTSGFARLGTPEFPVMDNMYMDTFFFSVPMRLVWDNFRKFMGEQNDPSDSIDYTIPTVNTGWSFASGTNGDYFGIPTSVSMSGVSALPFRSLALIWNEWFRDQNLQDSVTVQTDDGPDNLTTNGINTLLPRGKRHDYFTSCLPWPQKGENVLLPLGTSAPVETDGSVMLYTQGTDNLGINMGTGSTAANFTATPTANGTISFADQGLQADLSNATSATINDMREAFQIQKLLEKDARSGTRYAELISSHFGVQFVDATYRPEYLGGGSTPIIISPVAETANGTAGELGAMGTASFNSHGFVKSFTEHCIIIGFVNVRADLTYQQGLNRAFSRSTRYDFYWPSLAQIGEQAVKNKEIYFSASTSIDEATFGYQERYAEYRYKPSIITGQFRSNHATSLDVWHLSEEFGSLPVLNSSFIEDSSGTTIDRVIATPSEPQFIADFYFNYKCARPMPLYGTPGLIDHF